MLGALIGDISSSRFEWDNNKSKDLELLTDKCHTTDDNVLSLAIARSILDCHGNYENVSKVVIKYMQLLGKKYPHAGYGGRFKH